MNDGGGVCMENFDCLLYAVEGWMGEVALTQKITIPLLLLLKNGIFFVYFLKHEICES